MTLRFLLTALRHPEKADTGPSLTRRLLLKPRVFDLVSCLIQLRDLGAVDDIRQMLKKLSLAVVFYTAFDKTNSLGGLQTAHIVGTQKIDPASPGFDRIDW